MSEAPAPPALADAAVSAIRRRLLDWYRAHARDLPWRRTGDPYRVWLSEVMLQQTRVETVVAYFERWLEAFPTLEALAAASEDAVLKQWEGLGYYRRARNFHRAAREVVAERGGRLPETAAGWRELPGVGRYTAGAVASIAHGERTPLLDGNVKRVLARLFAIEDSIDDTAATARLWQLAEALVPEPEPGANAPGDFNQALMELGARICTPRRPDCVACPLAATCRAHAAGRAEALPVRRRRKAVPHEIAVVALIVRHGRYLVGRRPPGLLGGLWELPGGFVGDGETEAAALAARLAEALGLRAAVGDFRVAVDHAFTHKRVTYRLYDVEAEGEPQAHGYDAVRWVRREEIAELALPKAMQRLVAGLDG